MEKGMETDDDVLSEFLQLSTHSFSSNKETNIIQS